MNIRLPARAARASGQEMLSVINLVFLMLVFFSLMGAIAQGGGAAAELAEARSGIASTPDADGLALDAQGRVSLDGRALAEGELVAALRSWRERHEGRPLPLHAAAGVRGTRIVDVLGQARAAGIESVELQVRPAGGS